jgi:hypothetical protein
MTVVLYTQLLASLLFFESLSDWSEPRRKSRPQDSMHNLIISASFRSGLRKYSRVRSNRNTKERQKNVQDPTIGHRTTASECQQAHSKVCARGQGGTQTRNQILFLQGSRNATRPRSIYNARVTPRSSSELKLSSVDSNCSALKKKEVLLPPHNSLKGCKKISRASYAFGRPFTSTRLRMQ